MDPKPRCLACEVGRGALTHGHPDHVGRGGDRGSAPVYIPGRTCIGWMIQQRICHSIPGGILPCRVLGRSRGSSRRAFVSCLLRRLRGIRDRARATYPSSAHARSHGRLCRLPPRGQSAPRPRGAIVSTGRVEPIMISGMSCSTEESAAQIYLAEMSRRWRQVCGYWSRSHQAGNIRLSWAWPLDDAISRGAPQPVPALGDELGGLGAGGYGG